MKGYLLDTNVVSELRKGKRANSNVLAWYASIPGDQLFISVLVLGEVRKGIELLRSSDPAQVVVLERWLLGLEMSFFGRVLPITPTVADRWGRLNAGDPISVIDGLMAATALENALTLVTRNVGEVTRTGVMLLNPF